MEVVKNIVKKQNTEIDLVSGATYSSSGLLNAVKQALQQAEKVTNGEDITEKPDTTKLAEAIVNAEQLIRRRIHRALMDGVTDPVRGCEGSIRGDRPEGDRQGA